MKHQKIEQLKNLLRGEYESHEFYFNLKPYAPGEVPAENDLFQEFRTGKQVKYSAIKDKKNTINGIKYTCIPVMFVEGDRGVKS